MNSESGLIPTNIADVLEKLNDTLRKFAMKEIKKILFR